MKKPILILIALLMVAVLVLVGCMKFDYTQLNEMFSQNYSSVNVTVATTMNGETLTSTFDVTNSGSSATVNYSVQSFSQFDGEIPDSYITTQSGTVTGTVSNGVFMATGSDLPFTSLNMKFRLDEAYFTDAVVTSSQFSAKVSRPQSFTGNGDLDCNDMQVKITFGEAIQTVEISYTSANGASVSMEYTYTK